MNFSDIFNSFVAGCIDIFWKLVISAIVFFVGRFIIKFILKRFPNGAKHKHMDETVRRFANSFIKIVLYAVLVITIVAIMGIPMASVVTVFASAGAAIALAVQGSFSNFMGGIMLLIFKPIGVGDFVKIGGEMGSVSEVGIFYTVLCTGDNLVVSIPNKTMTDSTIVNYSRKDTRRVDVAFGVAYDSDVELVKRTILGVIEANDKPLDDPAPFVRITNMQDSALEFSVRVWCKASDYGALRSDLFEECNEAFEKAGIVVPFNQLDVCIKKEDK